MSSARLRVGAGARTDTDSAIENRRRHPRAPLDAYANKIIGDDAHLVRIRDISCGGVYLYKLLEPRRAQLSSHVGIEIVLPDTTEVIWAVGKVVREESYGSDAPEGIAVEFTHIAPADRDRIAAYVRRQNGPC